MAQSESAARNTVATAVEPELTTERYQRACAEDMTTGRVAPKTYDVHHDGETYAVDLDSGHCSCPDCQYRGVGCKHAIAAALNALFTSGSHTRFVALVARFAAEHGCPTDAHDCAGPCGTGTYPCPDCVAATRTGDWTVWVNLIRDTPDATVDRGAGIACDGGTDDSPARSETVCLDCGAPRVDDECDCETGMDAL